jgi:hypothetical protein
LPAPSASGNSHIQYIANRTTALATNSHERIIPANMFQPRAFVIAGTVSPRSASSILLASAVWPLGGSTGTFDVRKDVTGPVRMVEDKSPNSALAFAPICTGRALRFRGRGGRLFFTAQLRTADNRRRRYVQRWESKKKSPRLKASGPREALNKSPVLLRESLFCRFRLARRPSPWVELSQPQLATPRRAWATAPG